MTSANNSINRSFNDSKFEGNTAIQVDDNLQVQNISNDDSEKAFSLLFDEINKIRDDLNREQAKLNAEALQDAFNSGDKKRVQRLLIILKDSLGAISSLTTIASFFGIII